MTGSGMGEAGRDQAAADHVVLALDESLALSEVAPVCATRWLVTDTPDHVQVRSSEPSRLDRVDHRGGPVLRAVVRPREQAGGERVDAAVEAVEHRALLYRRDGDEGMRIFDGWNSAVPERDTRPSRPAGRSSARRPRCRSSPARAAGSLVRPIAGAYPSTAPPGPCCRRSGSRTRPRPCPARSRSPARRWLSMPPASVSGFRGHAQRAAPVQERGPVDPHVHPEEGVANERPLPADVRSARIPNGLLPSGSACRGSSARSPELWVGVGIDRREQEVDRLPWPLHDRVREVSLAKACPWTGLLVVRACHVTSA